MTQPPTPDPAPHPPTLGSVDAAAAPPPADPSHIHKVEMLISHLLRAGVVISSLVILTGVAMSFFNHPEYTGSASELTRLTHGPTRDAVPTSITQVVDGVRQGRGRAVVMLGLPLLVATPVARVAVSVVVFVVERDKVFVVLTMVVLTLLLLSFVLGRAEG